MAPQQAYTSLPTSNKTHEYETLDKPDYEEYISDTQRPRRWHRLPYILAFLCGLCIGILGTCATQPLISTISRAVERVHGKAPSTPPVLNFEPPEGVDLSDLGFLKQPLSFDPVCGNDRHQAKEAGCHYDLLATRWYSPDCYHQDVMDEMFEEMQYELFEDPELTKPASRELALSGDWDLLWPTGDFHIMHCLYQWRRFHKAILEHRAIDDDVFSYAHTLHCTRMIMDWPDEVKYGKNTTTIIDSRVSYCIPGPAGGH